MQVGRRYSLFQTLNWGRKYILWFLLFDSIVISLYYFTQWSWMAIPWQPISLIGIAVAFYLGFKNNSSYERLWEARKIWGGIVNDSRSFTVYTRDFINNDDAQTPQSEKQLQHLRKQVVQRHIAWLYALTYQLRVVKDWEHKSDFEQELRTYLGTQTSPDSYKKLANYLSQQEYDYIMSKDNKASHLLSLQSKALMNLRKEGIIEHFRHLEIQNHIRSFYELQGKSERIKNFPFPRQYATVNYFFVLLFIILLPFGMLDVFNTEIWRAYIWVAIPFSVVGSWVFWMMEMIGDYSENPFEGLYNDVPITNISSSIERDILQMLDETDLPEVTKPITEFQLLV
ncbi:MAG: hypothetical protein KDD49_11335 [Bacteroidetes bacterium]|nr:hypothetical protein [Bacteroidota bacterium]MCB9042528.1 hypothetical protein [Chitinophagales bacterium]